TQQEVVGTCFENCCGNISETARICGISRNTVRKILRRFEKEGEEGLKNKSRRPKNSPRKTNTQVEKVVVDIFERTNYGIRRIARELKRKGIAISYGTVWKILKRNGKTKPKKKITIRKTGRRYYNLLDFRPFELMQVDVKKVIDGDTLPRELYTHFLELKKRGVPMYQFSALDLRTRLRFIAYGEEKNFSNGWAFIILVVLWLRAFGVQWRIFIQTDWGEEFGDKSERKIRIMNKLLANLGAEITRIQKGKKEQNGYVERSHRTDDEELYIPYGNKITDVSSQFTLAYAWIRYYNTKRPHYVRLRRIDGKTPFEYLKSITPEVHPHISLFPPVFLDKITTDSSWRGGNDVCKHYRLSEDYKSVISKPKSYPFFVATGFISLTNSFLICEENQNSDLQNSSLSL
ncbi:MAG: helix-turn-helix domain-containing protein, partial [candidate division WOR-3 bacterium]